MVLLSKISFPNQISQSVNVKDFAEVYPTKDIYHVQARRSNEHTHKINRWLFIYFRWTSLKTTTFRIDRYAEYTCAQNEGRFFSEPNVELESKRDKVRVAYSSLRQSAIPAHWTRLHHDNDDDSKRVNSLYEWIGEKITNDIVVLSSAARWVLVTFHQRHVDDE